MKLLQFKECHFKNMESMKRMCATYNIEYEFTTDLQRVYSVDYTLLWIPTQWIPPPASVYVFYGPHFFVFPDNSICGEKDEALSKRCVYTCLSDWNLGVFNEFSSSFKIPIMPLYFGISSSIPDFSNIPKQTDCIVYLKNRREQDLCHVISTLNVLNISYKVFKYGSYNNSDYMNEMSKAKFCIWIGSHESQGFCFQETLVTNTPILLWDAITMYYETNPYGQCIYQDYKSHKQLKCTTANLWSDQCGIKMDEYDMFEKIPLMLSIYKTFQPRNFILENASDKLCMERILRQFGLLDSVNK